MLGSLQRKGS
jgi:hypothetical protein